MADMMCSKCGCKFIECDCSLPSRISHRKAATMSDDRVELRPCGFCGKDAGCINEENDGYWRVICPCTAFGPLRATEAEAIAAWNTRTLDPSIESLQAEVGRLREALEIFARCPTHGKHGGPFVIANAVYEDMCNGDSAPREAYWHASDFEKGRQALAAKEQTR